MYKLVDGKYVSTQQFPSSWEKAEITGFNSGMQAPVQLKSPDGKIITGFFSKFGDNRLEWGAGEFITHTFENGRISTKAYRSYDNNGKANVKPSDSDLANLKTLDGQPVDPAKFPQVDSADGSIYPPTEGREPVRLRAGSDNKALAEMHEEAHLTFKTAQGETINGFFAANSGEIYHDRFNHTNEKYRAGDFIEISRKNDGLELTVHSRRSLEVAQLRTAEGLRVLPTNYPSVDTEAKAVLAPGELEVRYARNGIDIEGSYLRGLLNRGVKADPPYEAARPGVERVTRFDKVASKPEGTEVKPKSPDQRPAIESRPAAAINPPVVDNVLPTPGPAPHVPVEPGVTGVAAPPGAHPSLTPALTIDGAGNGASLLGRLAKIAAPVGLAILPVYEGLNDGYQNLKDGGSFGSSLKAGGEGFGKGVVDTFLPGARDGYQDVVGGQKTFADRFLNAANDATGTATAVGAAAIVAETAGVITIPAVIPTAIAAGIAGVSNIGINAAKGVLKLSGMAGKDQDGGYIYDGAKAVIGGVGHLFGGHENEKIAVPNFPAPDQGQKSSNATVDNFSDHLLKQSAQTNQANSAHNMENANLR